MISDVACDPELPPELITSGMNCDSSSTRPISCFIACAITDAVSISLTASTASQPPRLRTFCQRPICM